MIDILPPDELDILPPDELDTLPPESNPAPVAESAATPENAPLPGGGHWIWGGPERKWIPYEAPPAAPAVPE
jgi:hypothetical protein